MMMKHYKWILSAALIFTIASGTAAHAEVATNHTTPPHHWTGKKLTLPKRMRGVNVPGYSVDPALVKRIAKWGCNAMRINFSVDSKRELGGQPLPKPTKENPLAPYQHNLARLDAILPVCQKLNIRVIFCASNIYQRKAHAFWGPADNGKADRKYLIQFWEAFARQYKGAPAIVAYDVFNEPHYKKKDRNVWLDHLLPETVKTIRAINPDIWLVIEPGPWNGPGNYKDLPLPVNDPHMIYSLHMYAPHWYTHQGVHGIPRGKTYPGKLQMFGTSPVKYWDKKMLAETLKPALNFARKYHVRMFVGEFGVARWAPGRAQWLKDNISLFEKYGFDWMDHSVAGWNGWNQTFPPDAKSASEVGKNSDGGYRGKAMAVLLKGWAKNKQEKK